MKKYAINVSMTTLSDKSSDRVIGKLVKLLESEFEITTVDQHSVYTWPNVYTGKPLEFDEHSNIKPEKFDIKNIPTDVL